MVNTNPTAVVHSGGRWGNSYVPNPNMTI